MEYKDNSTYMVEISLVDNTKDSFKVKGSDLKKFREKIYKEGYIRDDKDNKGRISWWISPFVIAVVTVTEINITLTEKRK